MKKIIIGCLGALVLSLAAVAAGIWFWLFRELPVLDATLAAPSEVELGATVALVITATNPHRKAVTLDSVDIEDSFLSGFQVVSIDPKPTGTTHVSVASQRSWGFGTVVAPGGSLAVTFRLKPVLEGHFSGDVDVCNPNQNFTTVLADVMVRAHLPPPAAENGQPSP